MSILLLFVDILIGIVLIGVAFTLALLLILFVVIGIKALHTVIKGDHFDVHRQP